jgi:hypothetical protein
MSNGDHDQGDEQPRPSSQLDQRCDGAGRERSMLAFRTVVSVLVSLPSLKTSVTEPSRDVGDTSG